MSNHDEVEKVGYGKPPKQHRFQKGQSGNPSGRPKKRKPVQSMLTAFLNQKRTVERNGKKERLTRREILMNRIFLLGTDGHWQALKFMTEYDSRVIAGMEAKEIYENRQREREQNDEKFDEMFRRLLDEDEGEDEASEVEPTSQKPVAAKPEKLLG
ncbi:MAG: DUF5681 domain-containing protein [Rhodospirillaceae bacterium]|nr:DUF5681 domain-containing protein [Rhodospirillaceae bacterium]